MNLKIKDKRCINKLYPFNKAVNMQALREIVRAKNHKINIKLPDYFSDDEDLEVIVLSGQKKVEKVNSHIESADFYVKDCGEFKHPVSREYIYDDER